MSSRGTVQWTTRSLALAGGGGPRARAGRQAGCGLAAMESRAFRKRAALAETQGLGLEAGLANGPRQGKVPAAALG